MKNLIACIIVLFVSLPVFPLSISVRSFDHQNFTRLVFEGDRSFAFSVRENKKSFEVRVQHKGDSTRNSIDLPGSELIDRVAVKKSVSASVYAVQMKSSFRFKRRMVLENPFRVVFDLEKSSSPLTPQTQEIENPQPRMQPQQKEARRVRISTICIDPGHGGSDLGAVGGESLNEKELTLKIGRKLKKLIESKLGLRVIMTRNDDSEVSLDSRAAIANNQKAQIFVSIHLNSSFRKSARGTETFYVSLKATDQEAFDLAQKENSSLESSTGSAEMDDLKLILWNMAQTEYIKESSKLAIYIQNELNVLMNTRNRGVKQAPFRVLMRAAMPAVLVEAAFLSNPAEQIKLQKDSFLDRIAYAVFGGIAKFINYHNQIYK